MAAMSDGDRGVPGCDGDESAITTKKGVLSKSASRRTRISAHIKHHGMVDQ